MQTFDKATRGPWGAALFVWRTRGKAWLAAAGAAITVFLLAFDPFTQQVIEVYSKQAVLVNVTGFVSATRDFTITSGEHDLTGWLPKDLYVAMTNGIFKAILGQPASLPNNTYCPTLECSVEDFTSLAICATCESEEVDFSKDANQCSYDVQEGYPLSGLKDGTYGSPQFLTNHSIHGSMKSHAEFQKMVSQVDDRSVLLRSCRVSVGNDSHVNLTFQVTPKLFDPDGASVVWMSQNTNTTEEMAKLPVLHEMALSWGSASDNETIGGETVSWVTGTNRSLLFALGDSQYLPEGRLSACVAEQAPMLPNFGLDPVNLARLTCFTSSSNVTAMEQVDHFGEITGAVTRCEPTLCARRYHNFKISPAGMRASNTTDLPFTSLGSSDSSNVEAQDKFNITYTFDAGSAPLTDLFFRTLRSDVFTYILRTHLPSTNRDWEQLFELTSEVLTQGMQNPHNATAMRIQGPAYGSEAFIRVRWIWFMVPVLLVVAASALLVATILRTWNSSQLFKNSTIAVLKHGPVIEDTQELDLVGPTGKAIKGDGAEVSGPLRVSFGRDQSGYLRLRRE